jgi:CRP-like cAMP-binding protein
VRVPLTQDDIADLCGTTRPTVNKVLRELEEQGVVDIARGRISILDPGRLRR